MKILGCARAWQAEAVEDGRLSHADAASFARHAGGCDVCERELRLLASLRRTADHLPVFESTPLERRRMRNELLRRANEVTVQSPAKALPVRGFAAALVVIAVVIVVVAASWFNASRPPATVVDAHPSGEAPAFRLRASRGAEWRSIERGLTVRLSIRRGTFDVSVDKLGAGQRFLLELPDGHLEVKGTEFVVTVDGTRTLSTRVSEGLVALRLRGREPRALGPGEAFTAEGIASEESRATGTSAKVGSNTPATATEGQSPSNATADAESVRSRVAGRELVAPEPGRTQATTKASDSGEQQVQRPGAGTTFAVAMSAFTAGDYGRAERLFLEFQRSHAGDARVEDAMFLRAVASSRRGDASGARRAAREYLRRYPEGLRKVEAERLARE
jgi:hypothetical protein